MSLSQGFTLAFNLKNPCSQEKCQRQGVRGPQPQQNPSPGSRHRRQNQIYSLPCSHARDVKCFMCHRALPIALSQKVSAHPLLSGLLCCPDFQSRTEHVLVKKHCSLSPVKFNSLSEGRKMQSAHCYTAVEQVVGEVQSVAWTPPGQEGSGPGLPASPVSNPRL